MNRIAWLGAVLVILWAVMPAAQQTRPTVSMAQAQKVANADRPDGFDEVQIRRLTSFPHVDDTGLRKIVETLEFPILPQSVARGDVLKNGRLVGFKRIGLYEGKRDPFDEWKEPFDFRGVQPIDATERVRLQRGLDLFLTDAVAVSRGPARLFQYLPMRVRHFSIVRNEAGDTENLSDITLRTRVTQMLDSFVWQRWLALEQPETFLQLLGDLEKQDATDIDEFAAFQASTSSYRSALIVTLNQLTPSHIRRDTAFLSEVLLGAVWKLRNGGIGDLQVSTLPESQHLYFVQLGQDIVLLFQQSQDRLRLVNVAHAGH